MLRTSLLTLALFVPATLAPSLNAAPPRNSSKPPGPNQLRWEIIAYQRGGKGGLRVLDRVTGSEAKADARAAYLQLRYPNYVVAYRKAR